MENDRVGDKVDVNQEESDRSSLPEHIQVKLASLDEETERIMQASWGELTTTLPPKLKFRIENSAPVRELLTPYEQAQAVSFITRYEQLPTDYTVGLAQVGNVYHLADFPFLRYVLNEFRPLIMNKSDSVYYRNVNALCQKMLRRGDAEEGTIIRALADQDADVTPAYSACLGEHTKAIAEALSHLDFDYLYNGILQHSDEAFSSRFVKDYTSGELNYILWKHVHILSFIQELLAPYHKLLNFLAFPKLGPL